MIKPPCPLLARPSPPVPAHLAVQTPCCQDAFGSAEEGAFLEGGEADDMGVGFGGAENFFPYVFVPVQLVPR